MHMGKHTPSDEGYERFKIEMIAIEDAIEFVQKAPTMDVFDSRFLMVFAEKMLFYSTLYKDLLKTKNAIKMSARKGVRRNISIAEDLSKKATDVVIDRIYQNVTKPHQN